MQKPYVASAWQRHQRLVSAPYEALILKCLPPVFLFGTRAMCHHEVAFTPLLFG